MSKGIIFFLLCSIITVKLSYSQVFYAGGNPGQAMVKSLPTQTTLENNALRMIFENHDGKIFIGSFEEKKHMSN